MELNELKMIMGRVKEMVSEDERNEILKKYKRADERPVISNTIHQRVVRHATRLTQLLIKRGATKEEIKIAVAYLMVCMDSQKHNLDWKRFENENGIAELQRKYIEPIIG